MGKGDAKAASQLRQFTHFKGTIYNVAANQSRIGYYVTVLDKVQGLEFVKKHRLHLFLRSELYAEYKLTKHLSTVQVRYAPCTWRTSLTISSTASKEPRGLLSESVRGLAHINMHILHTVLYTFPRVLTRRICWTVKSSFSWWSFPLFSWP